MKIILIGIQGAGKSTQGKLLSEKLYIPYLSTGHIFRELAKEHTPQGRYIKETMNAGYLIPDAKTLEIVSEYLHRPEYVKGYILDGFPRTSHQAEKFENGVDHVFYLKVSDREALWRLSYRTGSEADGREDETLSAIRKRIELFHHHTEPVIEFYRKHHKLVEVDGEESIEKIHHTIMEHIHSDKNVTHKQ
ncbi:MAG: nucleoside monophosphate kinase [Candidatus Levybacteria bacterium]|nr:nucleoside monophosphate kinase [Candidatus Levybacteria bacterium]